MKYEIRLIGNCNVFKKRKYSLLLFHSLPLKSLLNSMMNFSIVGSFFLLHIWCSMVSLMLLFLLLFFVLVHVITVFETCMALAIKNSNVFQLRFCSIQVALIPNHFLFHFSSFERESIHFKIFLLCAIRIFRQLCD